MPTPFERLYESRVGRRQLKFLDDLVVALGAARHRLVVSGRESADERSLDRVKVTDAAFDPGETVKVYAVSFLTAVSPCPLSDVALLDVRALADVNDDIFAEQEVNADELGSDCDLDLSQQQLEDWPNAAHDATSSSGTHTSVQLRTSASCCASSVDSFWVPASLRWSDVRSQSNRLSLSSLGTDQPRASMAAWSC
jgi:hypothetical protein